MSCFLFGCKLYTFACRQNAQIQVVPASLPFIPPLLGCSFDSVQQTHKHHQLSCKLYERGLQPVSAVGTAEVSGKYPSGFVVEI